LTRHKAKWLDGKVYFSSQSAAKTFRSKTSTTAFKNLSNPPLTLKANHQLALTGQYKQVCCPVTGEKVTDSIQLQVAGMNVYFNSVEARSQLSKQKSTLARASRIFDAKTFARSFAPAKRAPTKSKILEAGANRPVSIAALNNLVGPSDRSPKK
jgi:hypothetical protein